MPGPCPRRGAGRGVFRAGLGAADERTDRRLCGALVPGAEEGGYDHWQNRNVKSIGTAEIEDFLNAEHISARNEKPISGKTLANLRSTIHQFWVWLGRREKPIDIPQIPEVSNALGWRTVVDVATQQANIERIRALSWHICPKIWGVHILSHNPEVCPGELLQVAEQDILTDQDIIMIKWPKEGTLKGKHAHL